MNKIECNSEAKIAEQWRWKELFLYLSNWNLFVHFLGIKRQIHLLKEYHYFRLASFLKNKNMRELKYM
jgi:hypothetical protein